MTRRTHTWWSTGILLVTLAALPLRAQVQIKVNDDTFFKLGMLVQAQGEAAENAATGGYGQNVFVRRVRILAGGQIMKNLSFFAETDSPNLGKSTAPGTKNMQPTLYLQDAYVEYKVSDALLLDAGLMLPSISRNGLQSAATLLPVDYGAYTFSYNGPLQGNVGRDTGFQARGYVAGKKLEYRAGIFQGMRDQQDRALRFVGRVQYNFFDAESGFFYTGTYLGKKKVLALGGGVDRQDGYTGYALDAFFDHPLGKGVLTTQADVIRFDGGSFLKSLPEQTETLVEGGYLIGATRFQPIVVYGKRNFDHGGIDETRYGAGINYFLSGHNANVKAQYVRVKPDGTSASNQFTVQFQVFYY